MPDGMIIWGEDPIWGTNRLQGASFDFPGLDLEKNLEFNCDMRTHPVMWLGCNTMQSADRSATRHLRQTKGVDDGFSAYQV
jgi:hypothetical protein